MGKLYTDYRAHRAEARKTIQMSKAKSPRSEKKLEEEIRREFLRLTGKTCDAYVTDIMSAEDRGDKKLHRKLYTDYRAHRAEARKTIKLSKNARHARAARSP